MRHAVIVDERRIARVRQREASERHAIRIEYGRRAADDVVPVHQQYQHEVDAVAMDTLRSRMA